MVLKMLKGKIHRGTVTDSNLDYEGSLAIDGILMDQAGILENERIEVYSVSSGNRFSTYAIRAPAHSGVISVNGAAARMAMKGDILIICAYAGMAQQQAIEWKPKIVMVDAHNRPIWG